MRIAVRLLLLSLTAFIACRRAEAPALSAPARVIVISIDTLRSDHLALYGYQHARTPAIDALRKDGVLFQHVFSATPLTLPSHATILTGLLPARHGILDNVGYTLAPNVDTIATRLRREGFATGAAVSSYILRRETGIDRGFDFFDDAMTVAPPGAETSATREGSATAEALQNWIASNGGNRFFALLHLYEPHTPYEPTYDGDIEKADAIVGSFIDFLKQRGLYDDALIVLLSDHGEGLGDHGEEEHGIFVYREALQVPLIVKLPGGARRGENVSRLVSLTDVWPTIGATLGIKIDGIDALRTDASSSRTLYAESFFAKVHFGWREQRSTLNERHQYIDSARSELFDWVADPFEKKNLLADERRVAAALRSALPPVVFRTPSAVSEEDRRALESLGYLSSSSRSSGAPPDPKDRIASLKSYRDGLAQLHAGNARDAAASLRSFVEQNPDMSDGWVALAEAQHRSGDARAAMESLRVAMTKFPESPIVVLSMASALFERGQIDEARKHAQLVLDSDPVPAHELLAAMAEKRGDMNEARQHLQAAADRAPANAAVLAKLARFDVRANRFEDALGLFDRVVAIGRPAKNIQFERGETLLQLGRVADAESAYRAEVTVYPDNLRGWASLAIVQFVQKKGDEGRATLDEAMRRNPGTASRRMADEVMRTVHAH